MCPSIMNFFSRKLIKLELVFIGLCEVDSVEQLNIQWKNTLLHIHSAVIN